ncbi:MAG: site-specific integrase [Odoribacter sp.]|nr:site-specific integrase [Odoribacter sp.]
MTSKVSIKVKFRPSSLSGKEGVLVYRIIYQRLVRQLGTNYKLFPAEWDDKAEKVITVDCDNQRAHHLLAIQEKLAQEKLHFEKIIRCLSHQDKEYTTDDIVKAFRQPPQEHTLFGFMHNVIRQLKQLNKERSAESYMTTLQSFMQFRQKQDIPLQDIDTELIQAYEAHLKAKGLTPNTISFYMRILRAVYNRAVDKQLTEQRPLFKHVYTGIEKTMKRAISLESIRQIKTLDLRQQKTLEFARDMFLFSFYTRGMSFVDMAYLKKKNLQCGILSYRRRKTNQQLFIKMEPCIQAIINKYKAQTNDFLLPIIRREGKERKQYQNRLRQVNHHLKKIAARIHLSFPLSMYVARHSWASIARSKNIPLSVISEGMGHDSELTTQIYLASLDCSVVDKANASILMEL